MYQVSELRELHLEPTERCNARCPMCARNNHGAGKNPYLLDRELCAANLEEWFPSSFLKQLNRVRLCGNFGDPAACREIFEICELIRRKGPAALMTFNTNGSIRDRRWWFELGRFFREPGNAVQFAIDGLEDTHALYRRGTSFERILGNAEAFMRGGGRATWVFLAFEHNEHQVEAARELARCRGFTQFTVKSTKRFLKSQKLTVEEAYPVLSDGGEVLYQLRPARADSLKNPAYQRLENSVAAAGGGRALLDSVEIRCKAVGESSLYVSAEGLVFPCCWTGAAIASNPASGDPENSRGVGEIPQLLSECGGAKSISLFYHRLHEILNGEFFRRVAASWKAHGDARLKICARLCGAGIGSFDAQFRHDLFERPEAESREIAF